MIGWMVESPPQTEPIRRERAVRTTGVRFALGAIVLLAAANFIWQLGSLSYYVDEALSIDNALPSIGQVIHLVNLTEANPWTYFLALHEWLGHTHSESEWVTRLPSAIAGVAFVAAVFWLARAFVPRIPALIAAALAAGSPLVLQYAQEVRAYIFVMLALALAVGATIRAAQPSQRTNRLLVLGAVASVVALWLHYAAVLVIAPLCVWLARRTTLSGRRRACFVSVCALAELLAIPLFVVQYHNAGGLSGIARFNLTNVLIVAGTPFDGRFVVGVTLARVIAVVVVAVALLRVWMRRDPQIREPRLLCALAVVPVAVVLLLGLAGKDVVTSRYTAVAAPLVFVVIAAAITSLDRIPAAVLGGAAIFAAAWGLVVSHSRAGFYTPAKQTMAFIATHRRPGDVVAFAARGGVQWPYELYGRQVLHPQPQYIEPGSQELFLQALRRRQRIWVITVTPARHTSPAQVMRVASTLFARYGYRPLAAQALTTSWTSITYLLAAG
jgi:hypothetical protein